MFGRKKISMHRYQYPLIPCLPCSGPDTRTWCVCSPQLQSRSCPQRKTHLSPYWTPCWLPLLHLSVREQDKNTCSNLKARLAVSNVLNNRMRRTFHAQTLTIMSCWFPTLTMYLLLGEKATQETPYLCVWSSATCLRSATSHSLTAGRWPLCWKGKRDAQEFKQSSKETV